MTVYDAATAPSTTDHAATFRGKAFEHVPRAFDIARVYFFNGCILLLSRLLHPATTEPSVLDQTASSFPTRRKPSAFDGEYDDHAPLPKRRHDDTGVRSSVYDAETARSLRPATASAEGELSSGPSFHDDEPFPQLSGIAPHREMDMGAAAQDSADHARAEATSPIAKKKKKKRKNIKLL
jgi:hypothetical protein